jgi:hypothetical protein
MVKLRPHRGRLQKAINPGADDTRPNGGSAMGALGLALLLVAADPDEGLAKKMQPVYTGEVGTYSIAVESDPKKVLELKKEPVFEWANLSRGTTQGVVYIWLRDGRPAALGCMFSFPHAKLPGRTVVHEMHALDREKLVVKRDGPFDWKPEAGLERKELPDAGVPADTAAARLIQMKKLAGEFSGHSLDRQKKPWDLKLLPTPLYRYPTAKTGVVDGALFALISTAGTDPEVLLLVEASEVDGKLRWEYALGRFSDWELHVERKEKEVWSSASSGPKHLYRVFTTKVVTPEGKLLARVKETPNGGSELVPVEDK